MMEDDCDYDDVNDGGGSGGGGGDGRVSSWIGITRSPWVGEVETIIS